MSKSMEKEDNNQNYIETELNYDSDGDSTFKNSIENEKEGISIIDYLKNQMNLIKRKTGVDGIYVICSLLIVIIMVYNGILEKVLTNLIGTIYPLIKTIECLEYNKTESEKRFWLTYWIVFTIFSIFASCSLISKLTISLLYNNFCIYSSGLVL